MKALGLISFIGCLLIAFSIQAGDDATLKKERAALQGVWKIVSLDTPEGKKDDLAGATLEFDKDGKHILFTKGNDAKKGTFKINPAGKPKEIEISPDGDANKKMEGIYQIEKNTLKICLCPENSTDGRPSEFAIKDGKNHVLVTLEKAK